MQGSGHCTAAGAGGYNDATFRASMDILEKTGLLDKGYNLILAASGQVSISFCGEYALPLLGVDWGRCATRSLSLSLSLSLCHLCVRIPSVCLCVRMHVQCKAGWAASLPQCTVCACVAMCAYVHSRAVIRGMPGAQDDCWIADNRSKATGEILADPTRFPHGMKPLTGTTILPYITP